MIFTIALAVAGAYQLFALLASLAAVFRKPETGRQPAPVSILKPIRGVDSALDPAIQSHLALEGDFELLCGVRANDPAATLLGRWPGATILPCRTVTPNAKVGSLIDLANAAKHPILLVNDADIQVEPDYLHRVTSPLADPNVGLVTCLYRPEGDTFAARFEGLGVSTDFAPSALVARLVGVKEFAMGSTLAFRRSDLARIGGFEALGSYLADDYQLGHSIHGLGLKCVLSDVVVSTHLGGDWSDVWHHQLRWARTIRVSKFGGYLGLPITFGTVWALAAALAGWWHAALMLIALRVAMGVLCGWFVLRSRDVLLLWPLIPLRDLYAALVWLTALFGNTVLWRGQTLKLDRQGRIVIN